MAIANRTFSKQGIRRLEDILITGKKFAIANKKGKLSKITTKEELKEWKKQRDKEWGPPTAETQARMDEMIRKHELQKKTVH